MAIQHAAGQASVRGIKSGDPAVDCSRPKISELDPQGYAPGFRDVLKSSRREIGRKRAVWGFGLGVRLWVSLRKPWV